MLVLSCAAGTAIGANVVFTIDSGQSSITLGGLVNSPSIGSFPLVEQAPGSLTTSLSGTVVADTDLATSLLFTGGSSVLPAISGNWTPASGGFPGTQPAQFGGQLIVLAAGPVPLLGINIAYNDMLFDLTSFTLPLISHTFDATELFVSLLSASADWRQFGQSTSFGADQLASAVTNPNQSPAGSLSVSGNLATLVVPIKAQVFNAFFESPADITVTGQIVATALIPEPGTSVLFVLGLMVLGWTSMRHKRADGSAYPCRNPSWRNVVELARMTATGWVKNSIHGASTYRIR